jgi:hypothetical protein
MIIRWGILYLAFSWLSIDSVLLFPGRRVNWIVVSEFTCRKGTRLICRLKEGFRRIQKDPGRCMRQIFYPAGLLPALVS